MQFEQQLDSLRNMLLGKAMALSYMEDWPKELDSEGIVQEVLMKAIQARSEFRGNTLPELRGWLLQIFRNEVVSQLRYFTAQKRDVFRTISIDHQIEESEGRLKCFLAADQSAASAKIQKEEALQRLYESINRMPNKSQRVLLNRYISRMSMDDIAKELGITVDSVAKRLYRAIENLSNMVQGEESF